MSTIVRLSWTIMIAAAVAAAVVAFDGRAKPCDLFGPPNITCRP